MRNLIKILLKHILFIENMLIYTFDYKNLQLFIFNCQKLPFRL
jgi:hypothetical protein